MFEVFVLDDNKTLNVTRAGTGGGYIASEPTGLSCGSTCRYSFAKGASVTLTAVSETGSGNPEWQGCDAVDNDQCTVTLTEDKTVTANFPGIIQLNEAVEPVAVQAFEIPDPAPAGTAILST